MNTTFKEDWSSNTESKKAWMSIRDADLLEEFILRLAELKKEKKLRIVEWGGGRSTCWFTQVLEYMKIPYSWLMIEHDRKFFDQDVREKLAARKESKIFYSEEIPENITDLYNLGHGPLAVIFNHGYVSPFDTGIYEHRLVNMEDYISFPSSHNIESDIVIVDGRKRRRCVLEGKKIVSDQGFVLLHDAWRKHYQCSWSEFVSHRRFGDEWWIGSKHVTNFEDLLPWYAWERHAVPNTELA